MSDLQGPEIESRELREWLASGELLLMIDLRESAQSRPAGDSCRSMRLQDLPVVMENLPRDRKIIFCCQGGRRSLAAARYLREEGFQAWALPGAFDNELEFTAMVGVMEDR